MSFKKGAKTPAILGIDIGSTSSRCGLLCPETKQIFHVESRNKDHSNCRYQPGEFSSNCYPFDDGPVYLAAPDPSRLSISAKYIFYALTNRSDQVLRQHIQDYPPAEALLRRSRDPAFRNRLRSGLVALLSTIREAVDYFCQVKHFSIQSIALTVPAQWTLEFETLYRDLVVEIFEYEPDRIFFYTEIEGLAHTLITNHADELGLGDESPELITLFMDFGGHNMNVGVYCILLCEDVGAGFYRLSKPAGVGGGSESWEYKIGKLCFDEYERYNNGRPLLPQARRDILDDLNVQKRRLGPDAPWSGKDFIHELQQPEWKVRVNAGQIHQMCREALRHPLLLAESQIQLFSQLKGKGMPLKVVVSGGTAKHPFVQSQLASYCAKSGLPPPCYSHELIGLLETMTIARGAALATASMTTVDQFMERGAAFGIQIRQKLPRNSQDNPRLWDDTALLLLDKNYQTTAEEIYFHGGEDVKIICDPFRRADSAEAVLQYFRCYDVTPAWTPTRGHWTFSLSLTKQGDASFLVLKTSKKARRGAKKRRRMEYEWTLPVYFDPGTNCVLLGGRNRTLAEELGSDMPWGEEVEADEEETLDRYRGDMSRADAALLVGNQHDGQNQVGRSSKV